MVVKTKKRVKKLYELFGKGEFFLYLCGEIPHTITIPLL
jgi:hypothetical protein